MELFFDTEGAEQSLYIGVFFPYVETEEVAESLTSWLNPPRHVLLFLWRPLNPFFLIHDKPSPSNGSRGYSLAEEVASVPGGRSSVGRHQGRCRRAGAFTESMPITYYSLPHPLPSAPFACPPSSSCFLHHRWVPSFPSSVGYIYFGFKFLNPVLFYQFYLNSF